MGQSEGSLPLFLNQDVKFWLTKKQSMKEDVTDTKEGIHFICFSFFFGKGTRQAFPLRIDKHLPWDTEKKTSFLSVTGEHVFFLGNGKGINQGEGRKLYPHTGRVCQAQWGRAASYPGTGLLLSGWVSPDSRRQKPLPPLSKHHQKNICHP